MPDLLDTIKDSRLRRLYTDWQTRRGMRAYPARADFDPLEMKYILGNLSLIEVLYHPLRFRYRLHASNLMERLGVELTRHSVEEIPNSVHASLAIQHFTEVVERGMPIVYDREHQFVDTLLWDCEALVLPLSGDGRTIDTLMSGLVWSQPTHKPVTSVA